MDKLLYALDRIDELERKINENRTNINISIPCSEHDVILSSSDLSLGAYFESVSFNSLNITSIVVMLTMDITAASADDFAFSLLYDGFEVLSETKSLSSGMHSISFMKAIKIGDSEDKKFSFSITPSGSYSHTIENIKYFIWGEVSEERTEISVSASELNGKLAIAMVANGRMLIAEYNSVPTQIKLSDFNYFKKAIMGGIEYIYDNGSEVLGYYRIIAGENNILYAGLKEENYTELQIETNVACAGITFDSDANKLMLIYYSLSDSNLKFCNFDNNIGQKCVINANFNGNPDKISIIKNSGDRVIAFITINNRCYLIKSIRQKLCTDTITVSLNFSIS